MEKFIQFVGKTVDILMSDGATTGFERKLERIEENRAIFSFQGQEEILTLNEIDDIFLHG